MVFYPLLELLFTIAIDFICYFVIIVILYCGPVICYWYFPFHIWRWFASCALNGCRGCLCPHLYIFGFVLFIFIIYIIIINIYTLDLCMDPCLGNSSYIIDVITFLLYLLLFIYFICVLLHYRVVVVFPSKISRRVRAWRWFY